MKHVVTIHCQNEEEFKKLEAILKAVGISYIYRVVGEKRKI